jgi:uncharacterized protein YdiU (UPF0061 family)
MSLVAEAPPLSDMLAGWSGRFEQALVDGMIRRLGINPAAEKDDRELAAALIRSLATREKTIDRIFFDWRGGRDPGEEVYGSEPFRALAKALEGRELKSSRSHPYWSDGGPCSMHIEEVEALWSAIAENDDWEPIKRKVNAIRRMGEAMEQHATAA